MNNLATVILAAGLGTRMKSALPKVLHKINNKSLIQYVVEVVKGLNADKSIVVINTNGDGIRSVIEGPPVAFAVQKEQKGTGDALKAAA
ncbi:MAG: NTP transferase domain-containing protein, partial [Nitrospirae bacterium]|nr:NTP transferase domain-containing protein [Nitrospirota bacterium]